MPSVGSASSNSSFDTVGAPSSYTDDGPPESTSADGRILRICVERQVVGMDLAVDLELADAARDQLRVLRSEVEDEDQLTIDGQIG